MNNNSLEKQEMKSTRAVTFGLIGAALLASTASFATPLIKSHEVCRAHNNHSHHPIFLSATQKKEFASIRQSYRKQMVPLMQQQYGLNMQLKGKLATPGVEWKDIAALVERINKNHAELVTIRAKTQLATFEKTGTLLPSRHSF